MIVENQPMQEYLAHKAIGSSSLKKILESPKDYFFALAMLATENSSTKLGTNVHSYMLEFDTYDSEYNLDDLSKLALKGLCYDLDLEFVEKDKLY